MKSVQRIGWLLAAGLAGACAGGPEPSEPGPVAPEQGARAPEAVVVGAILPRSGSPYLRRYGELVLEGLELAVAEHEDARGRPIALEVVDDGGDPERASAAVASLEARGAVAVIGPLLPAAVEAAVRARREPERVIIAPLASEAPAAPNVYALNAPDVRGAEALARYAVAAGLRRVALLYPRSAEHRRQANAFVEALMERGGAVVAEVPYDSGTTTFAAHLKAIATAEPQALFVPAPERDVHQIAPQITYYGVAEAGVAVLGGEAWTGESVLRRVEGRYLNGVVAATPLVRSSADVGWSDFVAGYERLYRRSLSSPYPALGYDAMRLVLAALADGSGQAAQVARRIRGMRDLRSATGVLSIEEGRVVRRPFVVRIEQGKLVPVTWPEESKPAPAPAGGWRDR